jgi:thiosulfate/3-mercaptopyruvate sulfurtransferase
MHPIINTVQLSALPETAILIDAGSGNAAFERYKQQHLEGALYADLETDLAEVPQNAAHGGRHPLPYPDKFASLLGNLGITPNSHVVVYDDKNCTNAAARFWWMLRAAGHTKVQVLDGGLQAAVAAGFPTTNEITRAVSGEKYPFTNWQLSLADIDEVREATQNDNILIIDVRAKERYNGLTEPIDLKAGHIPSAINIPLTENLNANGTFLSQEKLFEKYSVALNGYDAEHVIVQCGSGVTACHTLLAIAAAGLPIPKLYVGSWSEWSRNY